MTRAMVVVAALGASAAFGEEFTVAATESRKPLADDKRAGLEVVERGLRLGNASFRYVQTVDPTQGDAPVVQQYGDYILGCTFPQIWNWDGEYFLDVQVKRPNGQPFIANRARLQEGIYILQQTTRGVAEMVWPLPATEGVAQPGALAVRIVKVPTDVNWFHLEARIEGEPETVITQVRVGTYPYITSGPPERQRWVTSLTAAHQMSDQLIPLDPPTEWGVVLHNKIAQEEGGCLFVFDPDQVQAERAGGTYNVGLHMDAAPGTRAMQFAFGYFWDTNYAQAIERFRPEAPAVLERLRKADWSVGVDAAWWAKLSREIDELLTHQGMQDQFGGRWKAMQDMAQQSIAAAGQEGDSARQAERRFGALAREAGKLKTEMYAAALDALVREAGQ
jgi:hypothetical protein